MKTNMFILILFGYYRITEALIVDGKYDIFRLFIMHIVIVLKQFGIKQKDFIKWGSSLRLFGLEK